LVGYIVERIKPLVPSTGEYDYIYVPQDECLADYAGSMMLF
jgi:hypothetical protein